MDMKAQWQGWAQQIAALSLRERILILLTGVVLLGAMGIYGWLDDADTQPGLLALVFQGQDLQIPLRRSQGLPILAQPGIGVIQPAIDAHGPEQHDPHQAPFTPPPLGHTTRIRTHLKRSRMASRLW
jgi:hypothetical protein